MPLHPATVAVCNHCLASQWTQSVTAKVLDRTVWLLRGRSRNAGGSGRTVYSCMCVRKGGLKHVLGKLLREGPLSLELGR